MMRVLLLLFIFIALSNAAVQKTIGVAGDYPTLTTSVLTSITDDTEFIFLGANTLHNVQVNLITSADLVHNVTFRSSDPLAPAIIGCPHNITIFSKKIVRFESLITSNCLLILYDGIFQLQDIETRRSSLGYSLLLVGAKFAFKNVSTSHDQSMFFSNCGGTIDGCSFVNTTISTFVDSSIVISGSTFINNREMCVSATNSAIKFYDCLISNNTFGILQATRSAVAIDHTLVENNSRKFADSALDESAPIYVEGGGLTHSISLSNSTFHNNYCSRNGGVLNAAGVAVVVDNCTFTNNVAGAAGGAIFQVVNVTYAANGLINIESSTFKNNVAMAQFSRRLRGGGAIFSNARFVGMYNSKFENNTVPDPTSHGGAVNFQTDYAGSRLVTETCQFTDNYARSQGGAMYLQIYERVNITNSNFTNNQATSGGGVAVANGVAQNGIPFQEVNIFSTTFKRNKADNGGGIFTSSAALWMKGSVFEGNEGVLGGGVGAVNSKVYLDSVDFTSQSLYKQQDVQGTSTGGGGLLISYNNEAIRGAVVIIRSCNFRNNTGALLGGAIWFQVQVDQAGLFATPPSINSTEISGNSATSGGAIHLAAPPTRQIFLNIVNTNILNNTVQQLGGGIITSYFGVILSNTSIIGNSYNENTSLLKRGSAFHGMNTVLYSNYSTISTNNGNQIFLENSTAFITATELTDYDDVDCMISNTSATCGNCNAFSCYDVASLVTTTSPVDTDNNNKKKSSSLGVGLGVAFGLLFLIVISVIAFLLWKKKRQRNQLMMSQAVELTPSSKPMGDSPLLTDIEIQTRIGGGNFGDVYVGLWNSTTKVALKSLKGGPEAQKQFEREAKLLFKLNHPNIVRALGIYRQSHEQFFLVLEFCKLGSLDSFLAHNQLTTGRKLKLCMDVAAGCKYMEQQKIVHRDLGARNLLLTELDGEYTVKISDLGLSRETEYYKAEEKQIPIKWSAPETIIYGKSTSASDVWSFGVVLWEIFSKGQIPYQELSNKEVIDQVAKGKHRLSQPAGCPDEVYQVMTSCWEAEPENRPSFSQLYRTVGVLLDQHDKSAATVFLSQHPEPDSNFYSAEEPTAQYTV